MNIIFQVDGGLGKSIASTAVISAIKKHYKNSKIIVVSPYPDVFLNNPNVYRTYLTSQMNGLYLKYIKGKDSKIFACEPYTHNSFLKGEEHLFRTWCKLCSVPYKGEQPEFYLTQAEIDYFTPYYQPEKPIFVIHPHGGPQGQGYQYSWTRDIPSSTMIDIINHYKDDYSIIHIRRQDQLQYENTLSALDGYRSLAILLLLSKKRLFIDSFSQHLAAALKLPSVVCWSTTTPKVFGYNIHNNILANSFTKQPKLDQATYQPFNLYEDIHSLPYENMNEIFDSSKIIEALGK
jgi:ADP-heptose:LPS heptosyltransferase